MRRATLVVYLALATMAAIAAAAARNDEPTGDSIVTETGGSFHLGSREGMAVFTVTDIGLGDSAKGTVEIANEGGEAIALTLARRDLADVPGAGGGVLSRRLWLKITDGTAVIYAGPLAAMRSLPLGTLAPGASRHYEFIATFSERGGPDTTTENIVQGASTSVTYSWTAGESRPASRTPSTPSTSNDFPAGNEAFSTATPHPLGALQRGLRARSHATSRRPQKLVGYIPIGM